MYTIAGEGSGDGTGEDGRERSSSSISDTRFRTLLVRCAASISATVIEDGALWDADGIGAACAAGMGGTAGAVIGGGGATEGIGAVTTRLAGPNRGLSAGAVGAGPTVWPRDGPAEKGVSSSALGWDGGATLGRTGGGKRRPVGSVGGWLTAALTVCDLAGFPRVCSAVCACVLDVDLCNIASKCFSCLGLDCPEPLGPDVWWDDGPASCGRVCAEFCREWVLDGPAAGLAGGAIDLAEDLALAGPESLISSRRRVVGVSGAQKLQSAPLRRSEHDKHSLIYALRPNLAEQSPDAFASLPDLRILVCGHLADRLLEAHQRLLVPHLHRPIIHSALKTRAASSSTCSRFVREPPLQLE